ncbi:MAG: peroxiredoxin family protein [Chloroflexi bacterium]|nr:peroxiredoxin family protein [Chloroflexota bacterium]
MSYARKYDQFRSRGAEVVGISVDSPAQNQTMIENLLLPFKLLSDPEGEQAIQRYGVWDAEGRIAVPTIVAVDRDRTIRYWYKGKDFADRPGDADLFSALESGK